MEGVFPSRRLFRRVIAILPSKSEHCLWSFWSLTLRAAVTSRGINLDIPNSIRWRELMCDFELAIHNAFLNIALNMLGLQLILIACCHMHYCSTIIKKVKSLGMASDYSHESSGVKHFISMLCVCLGFSSSHYDCCRVCVYKSECNVSSHASVSANASIFAVF